MTKGEAICELYGLIADINEEEVADHIKSGVSLQDWTNAWRCRAKDVLRVLEDTADTPQTEKNCDNCGTPRDKCVYCIEEDRMWTPQTDCDKCIWSVCNYNKVEWDADAPQTEKRIDRDGDVWEWRGDAWYCIGQSDTPQTDCAWMYDSRRDYEYDKALDELERNE